jgi:methyl-coenzyme M reductase beta subunit
MAKIEDKVDLYDDRGKKLVGDVPVTALSPLKNPAIRKIAGMVTRLAAVDLAGLEKRLETGAIGGKQMIIRGKSMKLDIVGKASTIASQMKEMLQVEPGDETTADVIGGGKRLRVEVPAARIIADYSAARTNTCAALTQAIIETFDVDMWHATDVKNAVWGMYPQDPAMAGTVVATLVDVPIANEGPGFTLRNIPVNHLAATVRKRAMPGACLSMTLEECACYEMGDAIGPFERGHLLDYAFEGLNANNLLYNLIKENGQDGTLGDVVYACVEKAKADGVAKPKTKLGSGYTVFGTDDLQMWNAYASAGLLAAVMVNCAAIRAGQPVPSSIMYFNEMLEHETGLPGVDYGKAQGTSVSSSFFSHSIYGGGGPGVFHGNHIVTRHAKGQVIPCFCAAMCIDADTQYFSPARMSGLYSEVLGAIPEFAEPMKAIAEGAKQIM